MSTIITKLNGKQNVVTFCQNVANLSDSFNSLSYLKHEIVYQKGSFFWMNQTRQGFIERLYESTLKQK